MIALSLLAGAVFASMIAEARVSAAHDRRLRARGAIEPAGDVYRIMQVVYPTAFAVMIVEGAARRAAWDGWFGAGALVLAGAKALKYWAMAALGERWTFRVLVPPLSTRIVAGPYRWLRHPNYIAVAGELTGVALAGHAIVTGAPATSLFVLLMRRRVRVEEHALLQ